MGLLSRIAISNGNKDRKNQATKLLHKQDTSKLASWWSDMQVEREIRKLEKQMRRL